MSDNYFKINRDIWEFFKSSRPVEDTDTYWNELLMLMQYAGSMKKHRNANIAEHCCLPPLMSLTGSAVYRRQETRMRAHCYTEKSEKGEKGNATRRVNAKLKESRNCYKRN